MATIEVSSEKPQFEVPDTIYGAHTIGSEDGLPGGSEVLYPRRMTRLPPKGSNVAVLEWKAGRQEWLIIIVLSIVSLMVALDATILVPVLPTFATDLDGDATDAFWAGTAYLLTQSVFQLFIVALSDAFGRRTFFLVSLAFFTIGTLVCCLSQNFTHLLAGRSVQGIGGGGIQALAMVIMTDIIPLRQRPTYIGFIMMAWALGSICGPLVGGLLVQYATWRWIFYLNFPFCGIGFLTVPFVLKLHANRPPLKQRLLCVDYLGAFLFIASTCSFLIGLSWGGSQYPWTSWRTLVPIITGVAGFVATILWERHAAYKPFLRFQVIDTYSAIASYACSIFQGLLLFCELYYISFYFESVKGYTPTTTGVALMPLTITLVPTSVISGRLVTKFGRYRWAFWLGWLLVSVGTGLLILLDADIRVYAWVLIFIVLALGHGLVLMSLNFSIQANAAGQNEAYAAAMYTSMRAFGMCIGVALGGTVFQNQLAKHLSSHRLPTEIANNAEGFIATLNVLPRNSLLHHAYTLAYANAFRSVFEVLTAFAGFAGLLSLLVKELSLDKMLDSEHVLRPLKRESSSPEASIGDNMGSFSFTYNSRS